MLCLRCHAKTEKNITNPGVERKGEARENILSTNMSNSNTTIAVTNHSTTISLFGTTMPFDVYSATYAILVAAGGIMGYVKAKSIPSLAAGLTFGALVGAGSYLEATQDNYWVTFAGSGVLGAIMTKRFLNSKKFMPAGLVSALSIGMLLRYSIRTYQLSRAGGGDSKP